MGHASGPGQSQRPCRVAGEPGEAAAGPAHTHVRVGGYRRPLADRSSSSWHGHLHATMAERGARETNRSAARWRVAVQQAISVSVAGNSTTPCPATRPIVPATSSGVAPRPRPAGARPTAGARTSPRHPVHRLRPLDPTTAARSCRRAAQCTAQERRPGARCARQPRRVDMGGPLLADPLAHQPLAHVFAERQHRVTISGAARTTSRDASGPIRAACRGYVPHPGQTLDVTHAVMREAVRL